MSSSLELLCIEPGYITRQIWPTARDMIRRAIERTNLSDFEAVERDVLQGRALLWLAWNGERIEAACTTELTIAQGRKACVVVACSGKNHRRWLPLLAKIEDYARAENCACMRVIGRKGWERVLEGYRLQWAILEKGLIVDGKLESNAADQQQHAAVGRGDADGQQSVQRGQRAASEHRSHPA